MPGFVEKIQKDVKVRNLDLLKVHKKEKNLKNTVQKIQISVDMMILILNQLEEVRQIRQQNVPSIRVVHGQIILASVQIQENRQIHQEVLLMILPVAITRLIRKLHVVKRRDVVGMVRPVSVRKYRV